MDCRVMKTGKNNPKFPHDEVVLTPPSIWICRTCLCWKWHRLMTFLDTRLKLYIFLKEASLVDFLVLYLFSLLLLLVFFFVFFFETISHILGWP